MQLLKSEFDSGDYRCEKAEIETVIGGDGVGRLQISVELRRDDNKIARMSGRVESLLPQHVEEAVGNAKFMLATQIKNNDLQ